MKTVDYLANKSGAWISELLEDLDHGDGICLNCGSIKHGGVEPDASEYHCEDCGENAVTSRESVQAGYYQPVEIETLYDIAQRQYNAIVEGTIDYGELDGNLRPETAKLLLDRMTEVFGDYGYTEYISIWAGDGNDPTEDY